uniref:Putative secreted protein n=1 Tax=Anopheles darlingi TaxID=43151 RepID=A0A2M4DKF4_ANODA
MITVMMMMMMMAGMVAGFVTTGTRKYLRCSALYPSVHPFFCAQTAAAAGSVREQTPSTPRGAGRMQSIPDRAPDQGAQLGGPLS